MTARDDDDLPVLVTGATGFVGRHLTRALIDDGQRVRALVQSGSDVGALTARGVDCVAVAFDDPAALARAVAGCRIVYHLAVLRTGTPLHAINVDATRALAECAADAGVGRFVHVSSTGVYGSVASLPTDEKVPCRPDTPYRVSKLAGEAAVFEVGRSAGLPVVVARLPAVVGPGCHGMLGLARAVATGRFRMIGDGSKRKHLGHVRDMAEGLILCARSPDADGEIYNLGADAPTPVRTVIATIADELGAETGRDLPAMPFRIVDWTANTVYAALGLELPWHHRYGIFLENTELDISKARRALGYRSHGDVVEAIREAVRWYVERGLVSVRGRRGRTASRVHD